MERIKISAKTPEAEKTLDEIRLQVQAASLVLFRKHEGVINGSSWSQVRKVAKDTVKHAMPSVPSWLIEQVPYLQDRERACKFLQDKSLLHADMNTVGAVNLYAVLLSDVLETLVEPFAGNRWVFFTLEGGRMDIQEIIHPKEAEWRFRHAP
jgi:hypothetical protein